MEERQSGRTAAAGALLDRYSSTPCVDHYVLILIWFKILGGFLLVSFYLNVF